MPKSVFECLSRGCVHVLPQQRSVIVSTVDPISESETDDEITSTGDRSNDSGGDNGTLEEADENPNRRKRATGYHLFLQANSRTKENIPQLNARNAQGELPHLAANSKLMAATWKELPLEVKKDWNERAQRKREDSDTGTVQEGEDKSCAKCGKRFSRMKDMRYHAQTCGEHICTECGAKFLDAIRLNRHAKVHTNPLKCAKCEKIFAKVSGLTRHIKTHEKPQVYSCNICDEKYRQKYNLQRHMKKKHV